MSESAIDRTARALDLVPFISANPGWTIVDLAKKFSTSPEQIIKDLEMLFMCGLPGYSHSELIDLEIDLNYVAVRNPQNLDKPRRFTVTEVYALLLGLDSLDSILVEEKMKLRVERLKEMLRNFVQDRKEIHTANVKELSEQEKILIQAVQLSLGVRIRYRSAKSDSESERTIYPHSFYKERDYIYFVAFCETVQEIRHFRSDRIMMAKLVDNSHTKNIEGLRSSSPEESQKPIRISLSSRNRFFIEEHPTIVNGIIENDGQITATFSIGDHQWLLKALLALPGAVEILDPPDFRDAYRSKIDAILDLYR